jgi:hypothetical protein
MKRFLWDYFGPDAAGTAGHFAHHLGEWLGRNGLGDAPRGVTTATAGQASVWLEVPDAAGEQVIRALRPKRMAELGGD